MRVSSWAWIVFIPVSLSGIAQQNQASTTAQTEAARHAPDHELTLDVVVKDKAGHLVPGLEQPGFVILDNKKPLPVKAFRAVSTTVPSAEPVKIILLVDEVNTNFSNVAYERNAVKKFLQSDGGHLAHPVSIIFLSDTKTEVLDDSGRDGNALAEAFDQHETGLRTLRRSSGFYGAVDRFQLSVQNLQAIAAHEQAVPGRKLLVWISPGWPFLSGVRVDLTKRQEQSLFDSVVALSTQLRHAQITLYSVDPLGTTDSVTYRTTFWQEFEKGIALPKDAQAGDLALQVLAYQTGGLVLNSNNDITALIARAVAESNTYYEVTVDLPPAEHTDEYHALQIKMEQADLIGRTRTGYYNQP
jgi:VWFA-related protein